MWIEAIARHPEFALLGFIVGALMAQTYIAWKEGRDHKKWLDEVKSGRKPPCA